jgi:hypothetical protein
MHRAPRFEIVLSLIAAVLSVPHASWSQVDAAVIPKLLGDQLSHPADLDDAKSKKLLDVISNAATKSLDQNNKDWNASSPKWQVVYDRVHADLESEMPTIREELESQTHKLQKDGEAEIAAHLSQSDVDAILAFYGTPEGQRYQEFAPKADRILTLGMRNLASLGTPGSGQQAAAQATREQSTQYIKMLMLSHTYLSIVAASQAQEDPTGYAGVVGFGIGVAVRDNPQELEALDKKYAADLTSFEAFTKTDAAQHLWMATGQTMLRMAKDNSLTSIFTTAVQRHESDWKALYLAQAKP